MLRSLQDATSEGYPLSDSNWLKIILQQTHTHREKSNGVAFIVIVVNSSKEDQLQNGLSKGPYYGLHSTRQSAPISQ